MPFAALKLDIPEDPRQRFDLAGRAIWIVQLANGIHFRYFQSEDGWQLEATVPEGYCTNFASVPRFFWRILPPDGQYREAAIVHDWLYDSRVTSRWMADAIFFEAMTELGVPLWKRLCMWLAVRLFAGGNYKGADK